MIYDVKRNEFVDQSTLPELNVGRFRHGSCATDDMVFVFGGSKSGGRTNTLDHLLYELNKDEDNQDYIITGSKWYLLEIQELSARNFPLVAWLGPMQILLMGGNDRNNS